MKQRGGRFHRSLAVATSAAVLISALSGDLTVAQTRLGKNVDWSAFEGDAAASHYSPLSQINRKNVTDLQVVWQYKVTTGTTVSNPIVIDGTMFIVDGDGGVVSLNAETGAQNWKRPGLSRAVRGLNYWASKDGKESRIFVVRAQTLSAIDARTGEDILTFGTNGKVDLRAGLGRPSENIAQIEPTSPGRIFGDLLILGSRTGEEYAGPPGDIRAYDTRTGKIVWTFHTIPQQGEANFETWTPDSHKVAAGVNNWGGMSLDEARGIVYIPLGSASYDFYGVDRPGLNLYANSLVALNARTGKLLWHFQTVHHDLWDYDLTTTPVLTTVTIKGKKIDVVAQAGKTGFLYVFDRVTGKPIWPIEERPVPASDVPGEVASPTQPFPTAPPPFARQAFTVQDIDTNLDPAEYEQLRARIAAARNEGLFTPPTIGRETVQMPGNHGGSNWGMSAGEPSTGRVYVAAFDIPALLKLDKYAITPREFAMSPMEAGEAVYKTSCQMCHGADRNGGGGTPELARVKDRYTADQIKQIVTEGRATMPGFGGSLKADDIDNVVGYLTGTASTVAPLAIVSAAPAPGQPTVSDGPGRYKSPYGFLFNSKGVPAIRPPWQTLTAYDLNKGTILWQAPVGTVPAFRSPTPTGAPFSKGGLVITAGGLIFASSNADRKIHAWDKDTGKLLWQGSLPGPGQGIPATYQVRGRQFLVVPAATYTPPGAGRALPTSNTAPAENSFVVYALPK